MVNVLFRKSNLLWVFIIENTIWKLLLIFATKRKIVFTMDFFLKVCKCCLKFYLGFLLVQVNFLRLTLLIYWLMRYSPDSPVGSWGLPRLHMDTQFLHPWLFLFVIVTTVSFYKVTLSYSVQGPLLRCSVNNKECLFPFVSDIAWYRLARLTDFKVEACVCSIYKRKVQLFCIYSSYRLLKSFMWKRIHTGL